MKETTTKFVVGEKVMFNPLWDVYSYQAVITNITDDTATIEYGKNGTIIEQVMFDRLQKCTQETV